VNGIETCIVGTLGRDPELRFTSGGRGVASVGVACSRRWKKQDSNEWEEVTSWVNVTIWAEMGENAAATLKKGDRVIAYGRFEQREYTDKEGVTKQVWEFTADEIGPSLRWATASVNRTERTKAGDAPAPRGGGTTSRPDPGYGTEEPFVRPSTINDL
jgi:single-strand DNA-binding protein